YATFDAGINTGWVLDGTTLKFALGTVAAGAAAGTATLKLGVAAKIPAGVEQFGGAATISDDGTSGTDPNLQNNTSSVSIPLDATPDMTLAKSNGRDNVHAGQVVTYTLTYANAGKQGATGVTIADTLPANT